MSENVNNLLTSKIWAILCQFLYAPYQNNEQRLATFAPIPANAKV